MTKYYVALTIALLLNASANLMFKAGMIPIEKGGGLLSDGVVRAVLRVLANPVLMLGLVCFAGNAAFYMFALQKLPISLAYPIIATVGFAIIVVVASVYLGENLKMGQWVGIALVIAGLWFVASGADANMQ